MKVSDVVLRATWWRFDRYVVRDGYIRPAEGAILEEYDFFDDYVSPQVNARDKSGGKAEVAGPHEELANLADASDEDILSWVHNWGLLGVLPHQLEHVAFDTGASFIRESDGWRRDSADDLEEWPLARGDGWAILRDVRSGRKQVVSALDVLEPYFPHPFSGFFETPLSAEFWHEYAEPVAVIRVVALQVREVMLGLQVGPTVAPEALASGDDEKSILNWISWYQANKWVNANAVFTPGMPKELIPTGSTRPGQSFTLSATTLLAVVATLIWMDMSQSKLIRTCERQACGKVFATGLSARLYCSDKCKKAEEMRRYRRRSTSNPPVNP